MHGSCLAKESRVTKRAWPLLMFCFLLPAFWVLVSCTGSLQSKGSLRVVKKKDSEKEKQIRILEQALAESQLSAQAKDEVIRALQDAPEVESAEEQARILEAAQRAVLQKYTAEVASVAELLTKSASRLAGQVAQDP